MQGRYETALRTNPADIEAAEAALDRAEKASLEADAALDAAHKRGGPRGTELPLKAMIVASRRRR
jgi:hypothetical protein